MEIKITGFNLDNLKGMEKDSSKTKEKDFYDLDVRIQNAADPKFKELPRSDSCTAGCTSGTCSMGTCHNCRALN